MTLARRVIVGASGTPGSIRAMRYARELAERGDATLVVVHAWIPPSGEVADRRAPNPFLRDVWQKAAWQRTMDCVDVAWGGMPADLQTQLVVARGAAGEVLVDLASGEEDLLVVGRLRGPLVRLWHGRVTRYCMAHARCPVLGVPPATLTSGAWRGRRGHAFGRHVLYVDEVTGDLRSDAT